MSGTRNENIAFNVYLNDKQVGNNMSAIIGHSRKLKAELKHLEIGSEEWINKMKEVQMVENGMKRVRNEVNQTSKGFSGLANTVNKYFTTITAGIAAVTGVVYSVKTWIQGNMDLSDSLANVRKTTGMTANEVRELYSSFKYLNTRTPRSELLALAEEAGRLGKTSKKDVMDFVEVANQISVALGDDLGGNTAEATKEVGKLTEIYRVGQKYGVDFKQAMLMVGSSINEVAANSQADAPFLIDFMKRLGGISGQAKITVQDVIGYGAALDQLGQSQEISGTTINKVILDMFTNVSDYASIAGMSVDEFSELLRTDSNEALLTFLNGLNGNNEGLEAMAKKLDGLDLEGARAVQVLASLSANTKLVREQQDLANKSLEEGTSLTEEYNVKNNNLAGNWEKIGARMRAAFVNSDVNKALEKIVGNLARMVEIPVSSTMETERIKINALAIELTNANTTAERRNTLYNELKSLAPEVLEGIDKEAISVEILSNNLSRYNDLMIKKIAIQDSEETLADKRRIVGEEVSDRLDAELQMIKDLNYEKEKMMGWDKERGEQMQQVLLSNIPLLEKEAELNRIGKQWEQDNPGRAWQMKLQLSMVYKNALLSEEKAIKDMDEALKVYSERYNKLFGAGNEEIPAPPLPPVFSTSPTGKDPVDTEKIKKLMELNEKIKQLQHEQELAKLGANEREIQQIKDKYAKLIEEAKGYDEQIKQLETLRDEEVKVKKDEQDAELLEKKQDVIERMAEIGYTEMEEELAANRKMFEELIQLAEIYGLDASTLLIQQKDNEQLIKDKYNKKEIESNREKNEAMKRSNQAATMATLNAVSNITGNMMALFDEQSAEFKALAYFQTVVNTAAAAVSAFNSVVGVPYAGPILAPIAAAAAIAFGAVQLANIKKAEYGTYDKGGVSRGSRHSQGGIHMIDSQSGRKVGEMEDGEPYLILSRNTYANNRQLIDELLDSSMNHDGQRVEWMKPGYYPQADISGAISNLMSIKYATGTITNQSHIINQYQGREQQGDERLYGVMSEVLSELRNLKYIKAVVDIDGTLDLKNAIQDIDALQMKSGMK